MDKTIRRYTLLLFTILGALALFAALLQTTGASSAPFAPPPPRADALPDTLASTPLRPYTPAPQLPAPAAPIPLPDPVWRIDIDTDGLYTLDYATLAAAGVPVDNTDPADFHLLWRGQPVALDELGTGDGTFGPGDALIFYGEKYHATPHDEDYTDVNVYWLTVDDAAPGLRMTARDVTPGGATPGICEQTVVSERNLVYWARHSDTPGTTTTWFWDEVNSPTPVTRTYPMTLAEPLVTGADATLVVEVAAFNYDDAVNPDHHVALTFNGTLLGDFTWDGKVGYVITTTVPSAALQDGANALDVAFLTDVGHQRVFFDRAELTYRQSPLVNDGTFACTVMMSNAARYNIEGLSATVPLYDVSDPLHPVELTGVAAISGGAAFQDTVAAGSRYLAQVPRPATLEPYAPDADLITPATGADEIIVAPRHFLDALQPLVDHRRSQGVRVRAVAVEDIYPLFSGGVFHPEAIRAFVAQAYANWPGTPPRYLFLVGDGNFNFKGYNPATYGDFTPTLIPPYREFADPIQGDVPVDTRFGDVDGDGLPEIAVGRIPAQTVTEVSAYVAKVLAYESQPAAAWQLHALFAADNGHTSDEGFDTLLNGLSNDFVPGAMTTETIYMEDLCSSYTAPCPAATNAVTEAWNAGAGLLTYAGHGSIHRWAHEPLIFNTDLAALDETVELPFLLSLDCWDGYWMFPPKYPGVLGRDVRSIGEWATTVLTETGAIAAYGPAGLAFAYEERLLARAMYAAAFEQGILDLGALTQVGREAIATSYQARTYTLLGDPALHLPWAADLRISPAEITVPVGSLVNLQATVDAELDTRFGQTFAITPAWTVDVGDIDGFGRYVAPTKAGVAQLVGHHGPVSASVMINVVPGAPVAVTVAPDPLLIAVGKTRQMVATPRDTFGNPLPLTTTVTWASDLGTIDATGLFTAPTAPSTGHITATVPVSQGTNTIFLTGVADVDVRESFDVYLPLIIRN